MSLILDTGFYLALINKKDRSHEKAKDILLDISDGKYGTIFTSDYILDETLTLINVRTYGKRPDLLKKMKGLFIGDAPIATLLKIELRWLDTISRLQLKLSKESNPISFTDCSTIVLAKKHGINKIVSFDGHFKGMLYNID